MYTCNAPDVQYTHTHTQTKTLPTHTHICKHTHTHSHTQKPPTPTGISTPHSKPQTHSKIMEEHAWPIWWRWTWWGQGGPHSGPRQWWWASGRWPDTPRAAPSAAWRDHVELHGNCPHRQERKIRVSTWVVVVQELFSLVTSVICMRIRGDRSEVMKLFTTWLKFFVYCCVPPQWVRRDHFHFSLLCKHWTYTFLCRLASYACMRL